jgi:hypothetical protein
MRPAGTIKQLFDLVFDGEIFNLAWIAVKNKVTRPRLVEAVSQEPQERAKAVKAMTQG